MNIKVIGWVKKTIEYCLGFLEKPSKSFLTYHARPKRSDDTLINLSYCKGLDLHKIAIVVQGPLVLDDDLTFETIKLYKKNFTAQSKAFGSDTLFTLLLDFTRSSQLVRF